MRRPHDWPVVILAALAAVSTVTLGAWRLAGSDGTAQVASTPKKDATTTTTTTTAPHAVNATTSTYDVPADIASDCSSDATMALLAWIDSVPDNSELRFGEGACYEIESVLYIVGRRQLTFTGNGASFVAKTDGRGSANNVADTKWPRRRAHWWFKSSHDITVANVEIVGANPHSDRADEQYDATLEVQSGFVVNDSTNVTITQSTISKVWGDFVTVEQGSSNVTIKQNRMTTAGRQGIAITSGTHIVIDGNVLDDLRRSAFDLEANNDSAVIDDVRIVNNTTGAARMIWLDNRGKSTQVSNIVVEGNTMTAPSLAIIYSRISNVSGQRGPWTVARNTFRVQPTSVGMLWIGSAGVAVHDNVVVDVPSDGEITMVRTLSGDRVQVYGNDFTGASVILDPGGALTWCEANNLPADKSHNQRC